MTVLGGLQPKKWGKMDITVTNGFNTDDGIRRATTSSAPPACAAATSFNTDDGIRRATTSALSQSPPLLVRGFNTDDGIRRATTSQLFKQETAKIMFQYR